MKSVPVAWGSPEVAEPLDAARDRLSGRPSASWHRRGGTVVLWSGGADSTLMLMRALRDRRIPRPVLALAVLADCAGPDKMWAEMRARRRVLEHWAATGAPLPDGAAEYRILDGGGLEAKIAAGRSHRSGCGQHSRSPPT